MSNRDNLLLFLLGVAAVIFFWLLAYKPAEAKSCKHENAECTINSSGKACCPGLVCVPFNERSENGKCELPEVTPTPTCTPTEEPTPTETPTPTPTDDPEPTPSVEPTPEATPEPTRSSTTAETTPPCPNGQNCEDVCTLPLKPATAIGGERIDSDTVRFNWFVSTDPHDKQTLLYGPSEDQLLYSVHDLPGDTGSYEVNEVWEGHWYFAIGTWNDVCVAWSETVDP